ncbi:MAG: carboxypeptidase-like regulatory domain-containing protein, partial [Acidobacteria bacterium]|nr:carboxypeptidase-like regulatory domain-containing protein [Acidobacteriota bacterium]
QGTRWRRGNYSAPLLPPGSYRLSVLKAGFRPLNRSGITLSVDQMARIDIVLELGTVSEAIEVTGAAPLVEQETSALGQVVDNSKVVNVPINGRNPFKLLQLTTNVVSMPSSYGQFKDIPVNTQDDAAFSINGGRAFTNELLIDGIPSTTGVANQITTIPNVDSTQEFKVQSSNLSAEWGRFGGGVINVSTRSGTNELHGSLYEFLRNSAFDANDFFNKRAGSDIPAFRLNQFGYAVGGPVVLPKLYNGKNRTFFFTDYQGTRWRRGNVYLQTVPTALQREGDFSRTFTQTGQQMIVYDPRTTRPDPAKPGAFIRTPFPENRIQKSDMDPVALKLMSFYPAPNTTGNAVTGANNYISNAGNSIDQANTTTRIDHSVTDNWRTFGRFSVNRTTLTFGDVYCATNEYCNIASPTNGKVIVNNYSGGLDNTVTLTPKMVLNVRYGFARYFWTRTGRGLGFDQRQAGMPESLVNQLSIAYFPIIAVDGYGPLGGGSLVRKAEDTHSILASVIRISGKHNIKVGIDTRIRRPNYFELANGGGRYSFTRAMTRGPDPNVVTANAGVGVASLLLGSPSSGTVNSAAGFALQDFYYAGYVQDDIRVSARLTLNLGLRYETESPYSERYNQLNWFDSALASPVRNSAFANLTGGLVFATPDRRTVYSWDKNNFAPRAGFAYSVTKSTVFRGGAGVFYMPLSVSDQVSGFAPNSGFSSTTPMLATLDGITPYRFLRDPYPDGLIKPAGSSLGASTFLGQGISFWQVNARTPYMLQWNADVQQALGRSLLIDIAYSGSRGVKLNQVRDFNALSPEYLALGT